MPALKVWACQSACRPAFCGPLGVWLEGLHAVSSNGASTHNHGLLAMTLLTALGDSPILRLFSQCSPTNKKAPRLRGFGFGNRCWCSDLTLIGDGNQPTLQTPPAMFTSGATTEVPTRNQAKAAPPHPPSQKPLANSAQPAFVNRSAGGLSIVASAGCTFGPLPAVP